MSEDPTIELRLDLLAREWGGWYQIWYQDGMYQARRRDNGASCKRTSPEDLRREIEADYRHAPVMIL